MTAEEIRSEIDRVCRCDWDAELKPLTQRLRQADVATTFHTLFQFAARSQECGPAAPAALLLQRVNPKCPITCRAAIEEILADWDVSIEEVPFYLAKQFGVAAVRATVVEVRATHSTRDQLAALDAIEYWLGCYAASTRLADELPD